ncbi:MAG: amidophosphoribosyltransferase, partial [Oscillospiraceae bacterium]|nr:amidophosphoribosyltransferase [Oscillospiraceae bacterium]
MGGFFGVVSDRDCVNDVFFGTDYHSHLGTRRAGILFYNENGFQKAIHKIENAPFRTRFETEVADMRGDKGIGCISDYEPQPLLVRSHLGSYAIATVGRINNEQELLKTAFDFGSTHFQSMSNGRVNPTELVAAIINQKESLTQGILHAQALIDGSMSLLILTPDGLFAARDARGRTPVVLGAKDGAVCVSLESFAFLNLGYHVDRELGAGEVVYIDHMGVTVKSLPKAGKKICAFMWTYYGYPPASYEGVGVEEMRYRSGEKLARRDADMTGLDFVAGVPDSGTAHAMGYAAHSSVPFARPFIKYTPTWPRSFMPANQSMRNMVAKMKLIPIDSLIHGKSLLFIDDSIVRGTQMRETVEFLYECGAREVHIRAASPPIMFGCRFLNFSRSTSEMDLITRQIIAELEGHPVEDVTPYLDEHGEKYNAMVEAICKKLHFNSLKYQYLQDMIDAIGIDRDQVCTYC